MFVIVAAPAAKSSLIKMLVSQMSRIGSPGNVHLGPDIVQVGFDQIFSGFSDILLIFLSLLFTTKFLQAHQMFNDLCLSLFPGWIITLQSNQAVFTDAFNLRIDLLAEQPEVNNLIRHIIDMGRSVMTVNTIHDPPFR